MPMVKLPLTIEHGLLGFVRRQPLHGYEIYQRLCASEDLGLHWGWKQSQLYAELTRLEQEGYLQSSIEAQGSRPPRKVFELTTSGQAAFAEWIASPVLKGRDFQLEFPLKLYFAQQESREVARQLVASQQAECRSWLQSMERESLPSDAGMGYPEIVQQFRMSQIETIMAWLETCAAQIDQGEKSKDA
ncbi:MAG: PadR family transcriptional regulator [Oscillochloris sp.]|nr:PadR family transcriptional regulator [Oscillochloris sp.]